MLTALLTLAIQSKADLGPIAPSGSSQHFQEGVLQASKLIEAGDFAKAKTFVNRMPQTKVTYRIDLTNVTKERQPEFVEAIKKASDVVKEAFPNFEFKETKKGEDIRFSFVESMSKSELSGLPQGAVIFESFDSSEPILESVISLTRMSGKVSVETSHIQQEAFFAFGRYFGVAHRPGMQGIACRTDGLTVLRPIVVPAERGLIARNLQTVQALREAIDKKTKLIAARVESRIDKLNWDIGRVNQGERPQILIGITNSGNVPIQYFVTPDCSCFLIKSSGVAQPGESSTISVTMDTSAFGGAQYKRLFVYTNDPSNAVVEIPVTGFIVPAYRILSDDPTGDTAYVDDSGGKIVRYLTVSEGQDIVPHEIKVLGVSGSVVFEPWSGTLPDPEIGEGPMPRKGYKITILVSPSGISGRVNATLAILTNNEGFKSLLHGMYVQKGIAAAPNVIYFGEIDHGSVARAWTLLTRPGRPFKILSAKSSSPEFSVTAEEMPGGTYKVVVEYLGKAFPGSLTATATLTTDSPDQKTIEVPIQGIIR